MRLGSAGKECLSPVAFDYLAGVYGYTGTAESAGLDKFDYVLISQASFVTADLNGDGRHALVNATMGKLKAVSYDGGSLVERLLYDADNTPLFSLTRMDFNGDGKDEILFLRMRKDPNSANADMQWMLYTANGVVALGDTWTAPPAGPNGIVYSWPAVPPASPPTRRWWLIWTRTARLTCSCPSMAVGWLTSIVPEPSLLRS